MKLITNRSIFFRGFAYQHARFSADKKCIAPVYDQFAERRFEFIPVWGFLVFLLYTIRRINCRRCGILALEEVPWGDGKRTLTRAYMLFLAAWGRRLSGKETRPCRTCREENLKTEQRLPVA